MQNLVEFVTEKGGGVLFIAGELFNPLGYRGTPLELLLPIELADARNPTAVGTGVNAFRPELTLEGRSSPIFRFGDNEAASMQIWEKLPELLLVLRGPAQEAGGAGAGRAPDGDRLRGQAAADRLPVRRGGQGDVPRVRRHLALAVPRRRPVLRPVLGPDDPVPGPLASWSASARPRSRPTAAAISGASRSRSGSGSPTPASRRPAATSRSRSSARGRARAS